MRLADINPDMSQFNAKYFVKWIARDRKPPFDSKTGVKGVMKQEGSEHFVAYIYLARKRYHLGTFKTLEEAKRARQDAVDKLFTPMILQEVLS